MRQLSIIVPCTDSKSLLPNLGLRVRDLPARRSVYQRLALWEKRVAEAEPGTILRDLYQGANWAQVGQLERAAHARGFNARTYVASAGLGLRPVGAVGPAYAATFAPGHPDTVAKSPGEKRTWWRGLQDFFGTTSFIDLTDGPLLVVLSRSYAEALDDDLCELAKAPDEVLLVGGARDIPGLVRIPTNRALRSHLGGATSSLPLRTAVAWLERSSSTALHSPAQRAAWRRWEAANARVETYERSSRSDDAIVALTGKLLSTNPLMSRTRALRALRDSGTACEQTRFAELFLRACGQS